MFVLLAIAVTAFVITLIPMERSRQDRNSNIVALWEGGNSREGIVSLFVRELPSKR
ncbi:MAG: hypothetical protein K2N64_04410 [Anaeroplasmataceae bacterium]|nr:hypothetical protein [Anaeroplasmataceae bacterium]